MYPQTPNLNKVNAISKLSIWTKTMPNVLIRFMEWKASSLDLD